jgi:hypothetical protein
MTRRKAIFLACAMVAGCIGYYFHGLIAQESKHPLWTAGVPRCTWSANRPCERQASPRSTGPAAMMFFRLG